METLPTEVLVNILSYVRYEDIVSVLCLNRHFNHIGLRHVWQPHGTLRFVGHDGKQEPIWWWFEHSPGAGLLHAAHDGHTDYYKKWSEAAGQDWDPSSWAFAAFKNACEKGHLGIVAAMLQDERICNVKVLEYMTAYEYDDAARAIAAKGITLGPENLENIRFIQSHFVR